VELKSGRRGESEKERKKERDSVLRQDGRICALRKVGRGSGAASEIERSGAQSL
jgi:hypothetical protein